MWHHHMIRSKNIESVCTVGFSWHLISNHDIPWYHTQHLWHRIYHNDIFYDIILIQIRCHRGYSSCHSDQQSSRDRDRFISHNLFEKQEVEKTAESTFDDRFDGYQFWKCVEVYHSVFGDTVYETGEMTSSFVRVVRVSLTCHFFDNDISLEIFLRKYPFFRILSKIFDILLIK